MARSNQRTGEWLRVSRGNQCKVCGKPDWCLISADGAAAICARTESSRRCGEAGWLHRLQDEPSPPRRRTIRLLRVGGKRPNLDMAATAAQCQESVDAVRLLQFADSMGLSLASLCHLRIGWSPEHDAWAFPMTDHHGETLGIRLRRPNGAKFAVTGSREGLFIPSIAEAKDEVLLICEGPTDTAALLDMGFSNVVGRPSCTGGVKLLASLTRELRPRRVVIVSDEDEPGRRGAARLGGELVAYAAEVRVITPPEGVKDARAWLRVGGTKHDLEKAITAASPRRLFIHNGDGVKG